MNKILFHLPTCYRLAFYLIPENAALRKFDQSTTLRIQTFLRNIPLVNWNLTCIRNKCKPSVLWDEVMKLFVSFVFCS